MNRSDASAGPARTRAAPRRFWRRLAPLFALLTTTGLGYAGAVPHGLRSAIVVKSIAYERGFAERSNDAVIVVVAGKSGASADDGRAMTAVLKKVLAETRVAGRKTSVVTVTHESNPGTLDALARHRAEVVYLASGLEGLASGIPTRQDRIRRIVVCADGETFDGACTLGVELERDKPRLVLNVKQANAVGLRFDPALLKLARTMR